jgi:hypothetical protein
MSRTIAGPNPAEIADVLDKAADHIDAVGWHQGRLYDDAQADAGTPVDRCRVCLLGAVYAALQDGNPRAGVTAPRELTLAIAAEDAMENHLDGPVIDWNDSRERTQAEVTAALRATAANLRSAA